MRRLFLRVCGVFGLGLVVGLGSSSDCFAAAADPGIAKFRKVAVVDLQRCILETTQGKAAKKQLEKALTKSNSKLERKAVQLRKQYEDLQAKSAMLSESEIARRQEDLMRKDAELQQLYAEVSDSMAKKEAQLTESIYKKAAQIIKQMAIADQIQTVLIRSQATALYVNPKLDLTNQVIIAYDKKNP